MKCPDEIVSVITEIIQAGILRIRSAGFKGDAMRCAIEADHIHNLPPLLVNYSPALLQFYWNTERTTYMAQLSEHTSKVRGYSDIEHFESLWLELKGRVRELS